MATSLEAIWRFEMALLWVDGFDMYGPADGSALVAATAGTRNKYGTRNWEQHSYSTAGRYGGGSIYLSGSNPMLQTPDLSPKDKTLIVGFNFKIDSLYADADSWCWLCGLRHPGQRAHYLSYSNFNCNIIKSGNTWELELRRGNIQVALSTTANLSANTWYSFQMKTYVDNSSGTCNVKIDDTEVISFSGNTAHNTGIAGYEDAGFGVYSRVILRNNLPSSIYFDDFFVMDGTGNTNNDFIDSDFRVEALTPSSDASGNWTSTGNNRYDQVNEDTRNESKYLSEDTTGNQAIFELDNLSANAAAGTVRGMMLNSEGKLINRFKKIPKFVTQNGSGGTVQDGDDIVCGLDDFINSNSIMEDDPDGNSWTASTVNDLRLGVELK